MTALVHPEKSRTVRLRYKVEAIVETAKSVTDSEVREALGLETDVEITEDVLGEYLGETAEDATWDLHEVTWWDRIEQIRVTDEKTEMVAPPEFVALPGMEGI